MENVQVTKSCHGVILLLIHSTAAATNGECHNVEWVGKDDDVDDVVVDGAWSPFMSIASGGGDT